MGSLQYTWIDDASRLGGSVVAIGNFDGVHRGHQAVLAHVRDEARTLSVPSAMLTFDPHPASVLGRTPPPVLTTLARKAELVKAIGVERVLVREFDVAFAAWSPERFATDLLARSLGAKVVVIGDNFRFGHKRAGDLATLRALGKDLGFAVEVFAVVTDALGPLSSTRVRQALAMGDVANVRAMLGRPHRIEGVVQRGEQRGRTLGFPTANIGEIREMLPAHGVYAVRVLDESTVHGGVMNLGVRPTVDGHRATQEVHLFDFEGDLYGRTLRVEFVERIRQERKFEGLDALKAQIAADAHRARELLGRAPSQSPEGLA
jgi:riboflavin kinase / FMN adenylyltransferase